MPASRRRSRPRSIFTSSSQTATGSRPSSSAGTSTTTSGLHPRRPGCPPALARSARRFAQLVSVGEPVAAIGSPLGNENTLTVGVVSAIHRSIGAITVQKYKVIDAIQTDTPITHGNSGGPLLDARGRVIGINAQIRSTSGTGNDSGIGFAIPIDAAKHSVAQLIDKGRGDLRVRRHQHREHDPVARPRSRLQDAARRPDRRRERRKSRRRRPASREAPGRSTSSTARSRPAAT